MFNINSSLTCLKIWTQSQKKRNDCTPFVDEVRTNLLITILEKKDIFNLMPMAPIPQPDDNEKPNSHGEEVDAVDVPDQIIIADSSDSEIDDEDMGYGGYQMLQQSIGDSDDDEDTSETVDPAVSVDTSGVIVDADVERSTTADEASRLPSGLFVAGGTMPSYMKVLKLNVDGYIYHIILPRYCHNVYPRKLFS